MEHFDNKSLLYTTAILYGLRKYLFVKNKHDPKIREFVALCSDQQLLEFYLTGSLDQAKKSKNELLKEVFLLSFISFSPPFSKLLKEKEVSFVPPSLFGVSSRNYPIVKKLLQEQTAIQKKQAEVKQLEARKNQLQSQLVMAKTPAEKGAINTRIQDLQKQIRDGQEEIQLLKAQVAGMQQKLAAAAAPPEQKPGTIAMTGAGKAMTAWGLGNLAKTLVGPAASAGALGGALSTLTTVGIALPIAAAIVKIAKYVYEKKFSQAAKACRTSPDTDRCIKEYKIRALTDQINALRSSLPKCTQARDPNACSTKIQKEIVSTMKKLTTTRLQLDKMRIQTGM
jgi:hypothetical protein